MSDEPMPQAPALPVIDLTKYTMEDGTVVSTKDRVRKSKKKNIFDTLLLCCITQRLMLEN